MIYGPVFATPRRLSPVTLTYHTRRDGDVCRFHRGTIRRGCFRQVRARPGMRSPLRTSIHPCWYNVKGNVGKYICKLESDPVSRSHVVPDHAVDRCPESTTTHYEGRLRFEKKKNKNGN